MKLLDQNHLILLLCNESTQQTRRLQADAEMSSSFSANQVTNISICGLHGKNLERRRFVVISHAFRRNLVYTFPSTVWQCFQVAEAAELVWDEAFQRGTLVVCQQSCPVVLNELQQLHCHLDMWWAALVKLNVCFCRDPLHRTVTQPSLPMIEDTCSQV